MYDTFDHRPIHHRRSPESRLAAPRLSTKILCTLATIQSAHVMLMLVMGNGVGLTRRELVNVFIAALIGIPALYLLARDMLTAPNAQVFRLGVRVGRIRRR